VLVCCQCDRESCENIVSKEAVEKLKLSTEKHLHPLEVTWIRRGNEFLVTTHLLQFILGNIYDDESWCDVPTVHDIFTWKAMVIMT